MSTKASARIQVVLDVDIDAAWGSDCSLGQVRSQSVEAATRIVRVVLEGPAPECKRLRLVSIKCADVILRDAP